MNGGPGAGVLPAVLAPETHGKDPDYIKLV
jgi:hypothetical protein